MQCGAVWCSVVQCGAVWCSVMQCDAVWCSLSDSTRGSHFRNQQKWLFCAFMENGTCLGLKVLSTLGTKLCTHGTTSKRYRKTHQPIWMWWCVYKGAGPGWHPASHARSSRHTQTGAGTPKQVLQTICTSMDLFDPQNIQIQHSVYHSKNLYQLSRNAYMIGKPLQL